MEKTLKVVGIGPGAYEEMTIRAANALQSCDVIVGYTVYAELVRAHFPEKEFFATPMRRERERCEIAFGEAERGRKVALICSGDAGIYGLAGLVLELGAAHREVAVEIIPGVTAAVSGGALLGAPLVNDFCVVSLSDLLTPWETIERRLLLAAEADFGIVLYNPGSHRRREHLQNACRLILQHRSPETVCGIAERIGREGEGFRVLTLLELQKLETDMFSTVFVGNSGTRLVEGRMVTPRGYPGEVL